MDAPFTKSELFFALQKLGNDKTPGLDGLSKEFMLAFWEQLEDLVLNVINYSWQSGNLPLNLKKGIIKLLPKQIFCSKLEHWRPITMLGIVYKILAKAIALRISPTLRSNIHPSQTGFIGGRSILDNILTVQLGIEHAKQSKQNVVMLQLDYAKAFDTVGWDFISAVMHKMGFGPRMTNIIYTLAAGASSIININGRLSNPINIRRSVRQGCPLSPLLFALASHPLFCYLEKQADNGAIFGLHI